MLPLFFQVVLLDTPAQAGARLIIPSIATVVGGIIAGYTMSRWGMLAWLVRCGTIVMTVGNLLVASLGFEDSAWKYFIFLFPANLGLGMTNPSVLFSFISAFEHRGKCLCFLRELSEMLTSHAEQAVATSLVYLIRSLGNIYGVTITSAIVQNVLVVRLPEALRHVENKDKVLHTLSVYDTVSC